jgi:hypothetical protein
LQTFNLIDRVELHQLDVGGMPRIFVLGRLRQLAPEQPRGLAISSPDERGRRERTQPPGGPWQIGSALERFTGLTVLVPVPVVHEPDVVPVLPLFR